MSRRTWSGWTNWVPFHALDWKNIPTTYGAYAIAAADPVSRAKGVDDNGILAVDKASALSVRLQAFINSAQDPENDGHPVGKKYAESGSAEQWPLDDLLVAWCPTIDIDGAINAEMDVLSQYVMMYGEAPPLQPVLPKILAAMI